MSFPIILCLLLYWPIILKARLLYFFLLMFLPPKVSKPRRYYQRILWVGYKKYIRVLQVASCWMSCLFKRERCFASNYSKWKVRLGMMPKVSVGQRYPYTKQTEQDSVLRYSLKTSRVLFSFCFYQAAGQLILTLFCRTRKTKLVETCLLTSRWKKQIRSTKMDDKNGNKRRGQHFHSQTVA